MKKKFLQNSLNLIKKYNPDLDEIKLDEIRYGLEAFYLTITKMFIVFILAILLNILKESLIFLVIFNMLRIPAGGMHANKSYICLGWTIFIFVLIPYFLSIFTLNISTKIIVAILGSLLIFIYSPADTLKAPIISSKRRAKLKIYATTISIVMGIFSILCKGNISDFLSTSIIVEVILIHPLTYRFYKLPYKNYKKYLNYNY